MPPQISDDEGSVASAASVKVETSAKKAKGKAKAQPKAKAAKESSATPVSVKEDSDEEEDDDDDDVDADEYVVEAILSHLVEDNGRILFEVKWKGYEKKADRTYEPEENFVGAEEILGAYIEKHGGKEGILEGYEEKKKSAAEKKGKKRGRVSDGATNGAKKQKNGVHPKSTSPPASAKKAEWKAPNGSWEEEVTGIDACEGTDGDVVVFLSWKDGHKTQHPLSQVYKRCPQKMLKFYESHLVFKKNGDPDE